MAPGTGRPAQTSLRRSGRGLSPARRDPPRCSGPTLFHVFHALRARVHFSCLLKRNRTTNASGTHLNNRRLARRAEGRMPGVKRRAPLLRALPASCRQSPRRLAGFPGRTSCALGKHADIPVGVPSGMERCRCCAPAPIQPQASAASQGPRRAADVVSAGVACAQAHALQARRTRAGFSGTPVQRWVVDDKARRGECRDALAFSPAQDVLAKSPATAPGPCGQEVRGARKRGGLSFGSFSLDKQRK